MNRETPDSLAATGHASAVPTASEGGGAPDAPATPGGGHALAFIFVTLLIDTIGLGIIIPVLPRLIQQLTDKGLDQAAVYGGALAFAYSLTQFLCGPVIGNLSDHFGRRPVLFASLAAFGLDYIVMGLAPHLWWLFVGRVVAGVAGASYTTGMAFIADVSPPARRAQNFGLVGMAFGVGFIIGPALGGLLGSFGPRVPFFASAALALVNLLYGVLVLPESLPTQRRRAFSWRRAHVLGTFASLRPHAGVLALLAALSLWALAHQAFQNTWSYYTMLKFGWTETAVGASLAAIGVVVAITQGGLTRVLIPRWGEWNAATVGMVCVAVAYAVYATAPYGWVMYVGTLAFSLGGLVMPSLQAVMSRAVPADAQGGLQGAVASTVGLAAIVGPPLATGVFSLFAKPGAQFFFPGASFACAAVLTLASLAVLRAVRRRS
ncbi:MAG: TCR/Tet family MFS transporter [Phycisphaerae bacterium]|jgi:DHA1 family tetracycline resistance protein-like MFS transporter